MKERPTKYITTELLIEYNNAAIREKRNRKFNRKNLISVLKPEERFIVMNEFQHSKNEMRIGIFIDNSVYYIDVSVKRYNSLPNIYYDKNGKMFIETLTDAAERRPYGENREWIDKIETKPKRTSNFSRKVKQAYKNQCAVCGTKDHRILIAAHIKAIKDGGDDSISNGICLCRNHDSQYENGDLLIDELGIIYSKEYKNIKMQYPKEISNFPSKENLLFRFNMIKTT